MESLNFEDFFYETWDYVSGKIVDDNFWDMYQDELREITHDYYNIYDKSRYVDIHGNEQTLLTPKMAGRLLEIVFFHMIRTGALGE